MCSVELTSASAGSGKTTALINKLVDLLLEYPASKIVAITFTNAAVREIKERISKKGVGNDLNISTIHSFFASILREQSLLIGLSPVFKILEAEDAKYIFNEICKTVILEHINDEQCKNIIADYGYENLLSIMNKFEDKYSLIRQTTFLNYNDFLILEKNAEQKMFFDFIEANNFNKLLNDIITSYCSDQNNKLNQAACILKPFCIQLLPLIEIYRSNYKDRNIFEKIINIVKNVEKIKYVKRLTNLKGWQTQEEMSSVQDAIIVFNQIIDIVNDFKLGDNSVVELAATYQSFVMMLFNKIHRLFCIKKTEMEALDYNDIEIMTSELISNYTDIAFFYKKKYFYILVDEYQDTNVIQKEILLKLSNNFYFVGDAKQSIYRFRNADVSVFIETEKSLQLGSTIELGCNYRSKQNIVDFTNKFFDILFNQWIDKKNEFDADYKNVLSKRDDNDGGIVEIIDTGLSNVKSNNVYIEAECVVDIIQKGLLRGRNFVDYTILFRAKENMSIFEKVLRKKMIPCMVLGKSKRYEAIKLIKNIVKAVNNPYDDYSFFFVCRLPFFYISDDALYKIKGKEKNIWSGLLSYDFSLNSLNLLDSDIKSAKNIIKYINILKNKKLDLSFQEYVISVLKFGKIIPSIAALYPGQEHGLEEYILRVANKVAEFGYDLDKFVNYLSISDVNSSEHNSSNNVVHLMTVHSAKGLQFPVTILPCLYHESKFNDWLVISSKGETSIKIPNEYSNKKNNTAYYNMIKNNEYNAELAEAKRLFYVAVTRAKDELYLIGNFNTASLKENKKAEKSLKWIDWIYKISSESIKKMDVFFEENTSVSICKPKRYVVNINKDIDFEYLNKKNIPFYNYLTVSMLKEFINTDNYKSTESKNFNLNNKKYLFKNVGDVIHLVLEKYNDKDAVKTIINGLTDNEVDKTQYILNNFINSDLGKRVMQSTDLYFTEYSFVAKILNNIINGRIDRINVYNDHVWLIDYKVGINQLALQEYKIQLYAYICFAAKKFPNKIIKGSIIDVLECKEYSFTENEFSNLTFST